jgi:ABC-type branched-subunit amino acid transport system substrate-binding protein
MRMSGKWIIPAAVLVLLGWGAGRAQDVQVVDSLFYRGVAAFQKGQYNETLKFLDMLDQVYPNHPRTTAAFLLKAKVAFQQKRYQSALKTYQQLIREFPGSQYVDDAIYGVATIYYQMELYEKSVILLLDLLDRSSDTRLQKKAAQSSIDIMNAHMTVGELSQLIEKVGGARGKAAITLRLAQRAMDNKHYQQARQTLGDFIKRYPDNPYLEQLRKLRVRAEQLGHGILKCGVILPLTGAMAEPGKEMLEGIQFAVDRHNEGTGASVEIIVRDSGSRILQAVRAMQELCGNREIVAIIGELESDITAAIAAVAQEYGIPLLAPTATVDGLTGIGNCIFQLNGGLSARGEMLAEYALRNLGLRRFAVLAPADDYGKPMRDSFVRKIEETGGEILIEKWYFEGAEELGSYLGTQLKGIREEGLKRMLKDSVVVQITEEEMEALEERGLPEQPIYTTQDFPGLVDSTSLAVTSIDGFFLPVFHEHLQYVAPQLAYNNFRTVFLGGVPWNDPEFLDEHRNYVDGVYFLSDFYPDPFDSRYFRLRDNYRRTTGKDLENMTIFGYDAMGLLLHVAGEKALPREQIRDRMTGIKDFQGIRGSVTFNKDRVNVDMHLLQYLDGKLIWIK